MSIMFGNIPLKEVVEKEYLQEVEKCFKEIGLTHQSSPNELKHNEYHIFEIPPILLIGSESKAEKLVSLLIERDLIDKFTVLLEVTVKED